MPAQYDAIKHRLKRDNPKMGDAEAKERAAKIYNTVKKPGAPAVGGRKHG